MSGFGMALLQLRVKYVTHLFVIQAGVIEEIVNDAVDTALDSEDIEEETEEEVEKVLNELAGETAAQLPEAIRKERAKLPAQSASTSKQVRDTLSNFFL